MLDAWISSQTLLNFPNADDDLKRQFIHACTLLVSLQCDVMELCNHEDYIRYKQTVVHGTMLVSKVRHLLEQILSRYAAKFVLKPLRSAERQINFPICASIGRFEETSSLLNTSRVFNHTMNSLCHVSWDASTVSYFQWNAAIGDFEKIIDSVSTDPANLWRNLKNRFSQPANDQTKKEILEEVNMVLSTAAPLPSIQSENTPLYDALLHMQGFDVLRTHIQSGGAYDPNIAARVNCLTCLKDLSNPSKHEGIQMMSVADFTSFSRDNQLRSLLDVQFLLPRTLGARLYAWDVYIDTAGSVPVALSIKISDKFNQIYKSAVVTDASTQLMIKVMREIMPADYHTGDVLVFDPLLVVNGEVAAVLNFMGVSHFHSDIQLIVLHRLAATFYKSKHVGRSYMMKSTFDILPIIRISLEHITTLLSLI